MGRVKGIGSFVLVAAVVFLVLRGLHVGIPAFVPGTRPGPIAIASLDEVRRRVGFRPIVPAYRPAALGDRPATMTATLRPAPAFVIVWQGEYYLSLTQRQGGAAPEYPPTAQALRDVPGSMWWQDGARAHVVLSRGEFWIEMVTDLPERDLKRLADTLTPY